MQDRDQETPAAALVALQWFIENEAMIRSIYRYYGYDRGITPDDWDDWMQEAYLAVLAGIQSYNPEHPTGARLSTYLYCCLRNEITAMCRKRYKPVYSASGRKWFDDGSHGNRWDESAIAIKIDVEQFIKQLPVSLQQTVMLHLAGYKCKDIASITEVQEGTVRKRLQRVRKALQKFMADANVSDDR